MTRFAWNATVLFMLALTASTAGAAADNAMFNYQGRVLVQGVPYSGTGRMKAAILATTGTYTVSLWSNDGTSVGGNEPTNSFDVSVTAGVFDVMMGDTTVSGMAAIPAIMFNRNDELKVRVWFNDGVHGYQQLSPDRRLTNPRRLGLTEVHSETHLYVNAATGNDINSGLTATTGPKKTIQAAVDMIPSRLCNNVTIDVAEGTYRESVTIAGVVAAEPYRLVIVGDKTTVPTETVAPAVRLTGTDNDSNHTIIRQNGFIVSRCQNIDIKGFLVDYFSQNGIVLFNSNCNMYCCKTSYNQYGITWSGGDGSAVDSWSTFNYTGYHGLSRSDMSLNRSSAASNTDFGILCQGYCNAMLYGNTYFKGSIFGIALQNSYLWVDTYDPGHPYIQNNTYGIQIYFHSSTRNIGAATYSGNGTNMNVAADSWAN